MTTPIPPDMALTREDVLDFNPRIMPFPDVCRAFPELAEQGEREIQRIIADHEQYWRMYGLRKYIKHDGQWYVR